MIREIYIHWMHIKTSGVTRHLNDEWNTHHQMRTPIPLTIILSLNHVKEKRVYKAFIVAKDTQVLTKR